MKKLTFDFWHTEHNGDITAAYFVTDKKYPGLNVCQDYPVSYDEIILPAAPDQKVILPTKTNRLSSVLRGCVRNSIPAFGQAPEVYRIKETFSTKTTRKRNGELKRFINAGGKSAPWLRWQPARLLTCTSRCSGPGLWIRSGVMTNSGLKRSLARYHRWFPGMRSFFTGRRVLST
jgi:hypothetical protein